jgi:hypothetical protein
MLEPPPQLNPEQVKELHAWESFLGRFYVAAILAILAAMLLVFFLGEQPWVRRVALLIGVGLLVVGAVIQRRVRCPSCKGRLGFPSKMRFPDFCPKCRVHFPRPESEITAPRLPRTK